MDKCELTINFPTDLSSALPELHIFKSIQSGISLAHGRYEILDVVTRPQDRRAWESGQWTDQPP